MKLVACPGCQRHVRINEASCPFCSVSMEGVTARTLGPLRERSRAAIVFFGAATTIAGCGKDAATQPDAGPKIQIPAPPYGVPVFDEDAGMQAQPPVPAYGVPPPNLEPPQPDAGRPKPKSKP